VFTVILTIIALDEDVDLPFLSPTFYFVSACFLSVYVYLKISQANKALKKLNNPSTADDVIHHCGNDSEPSGHEIVDEVNDEESTNVDLLEEGLLVATD
jgi:hypothetical protein